MIALKKTLKWGLIVFIIVSLIYLGYVIFLPAILFSQFRTYDLKQELIDNYRTHKGEIIEVKNYFNSIVPKDKTVEIEFEGDNKLSRFGVSSFGVTSETINYPTFLEWNLEINSEKVDSVIKTLGWTQKTLRDLKGKLDKANCIQIANGEPTQIGYQRSGMGMYFYNVFGKPIPDSLKQRYNDSCTYILYNDKLALEYGGGAVGPQCFNK